MKNLSYTKKGPGRKHNHETVAAAQARREKVTAARRSLLVGAAAGMASAVEVKHGVA